MVVMPISRAEGFVYVEPALSISQHRSACHGLVLIVPAKSIGIRKGPWDYAKYSTYRRNILGHTLQKSTVNHRIPIQGDVTVSIAKRFGIFKLLTHNFLSLLVNLYDK